MKRKREEMERSREEEEVVFRSIKKVFRQEKGKKKRGEWKGGLKE